MTLFKDAEMFLPKEALSFLTGIQGKAKQKLGMDRDERVNKARQQGESIVDEALGIWEQAKQECRPDINPREDFREFARRATKEEKDRIERFYGSIRRLLLGRKPEDNKTQPATIPTPGPVNTALPVRSPKTRPAGPTYYDILGVSPTAKPDEIHQAYLALSRINHPDKSRSGQSHKFQANLNAAYAVLGDKLKRMQYDIETGILAVPSHY